MLNSKTSIDNTGMNVVMSSDDAVASLCGRIDIDSSPAVRDALLALLNVRHPGVVTIDLSAVTHIDSSGVATLIEALKVARAQKTEMRLQGLEDRLLRLFDITGILSLFNRERPNMSESGNKTL
jgi:anti-sigma B factor antagonist